jgi:hypothetical protein
MRLSTVKENSGFLNLSDIYLLVYCKLILGGESITWL